MSMYPDLYEFAEFGDLGALEDVFVAILAVYMLIGLIGSIYSIVVYVLHSLGMYTIAKRRGIHNPWLAWIPVANTWILGSISDQYQYVTKGKVTKRRKVLIGLIIALYALLIVLIVAAVVFLVDVAVVGLEGELSASTAMSALVVLLSYLAMLVIAIVTLVFEYVSYYDLYTSCNPNNATAFLVLSIFFNFLPPFFVFASRNKDLGMPPRREPSPQPVLPVMPAAEPVTEENQEDLVQEEDFEPEE